MDVLLVTLGTAGDIHPFLALGCELKRRNHRVTLVSNPYFKPWAERLGLGFYGFGSVEHFQAVLADPDVWHPFRGFKVLVRELFLGSMRPAFEAIDQVRSRASVLLAPGYLYGARIAAEKFNLPLATVALQPAALWSAENPVVLAPHSWSRFVPVWLRSLIVQGIDHLFLEGLLAPETNRFRRELGLPAVSRVATRWPYSPDLLIALFPEWFAPPPSDWPAHLVQTGFLSHESFDTRPLAPECEDFLARGEAPILFTPGSGHCQAETFFQVATAVCEKLGQRGLFLTAFQGHLPKELPETIRHFDYLPFSRIFPRCKAVVHHGGIGTLSKGLAASVPQLIMPLAYDQPDNARRIKHLGVGDWISPKHFNPIRVEEKLKSLITSDAIRRQCRKIAPLIDTESALADSCGLIEMLGTG